ncbi:hypothetical protein StAP1_113 [Staphylococcus phage vB_SauH_SAP1]|uniref:Uncharacterized protein n=1 Tax=Staphylococcus phage vB_SauH_SAP1 TaxID=2759206 RepID=A0A7G7WVK1_9CAUD|nr:hypothetical protein StAP1_113 [Staphylococcus phage vB_SauH_SAP1]
MKAEPIARFFRGKTLQIEGYRVVFTQTSSVDTLYKGSSALALEVSVYTLTGTRLLDTNILITNLEKLTAKDLYTDISNKLQEIVGDQTKTDIELSRYFKEVK